MMSLELSQIEEDSGIKKRNMIPSSKVTQTIDGKDQQIQPKTSINEEVANHESTI